MEIYRRLSVTAIFTPGVGGATVAKCLYHLILRVSAVGQNRLDFLLKIHRFEWLTQLCLFYTTKLTVKFLGSFNRDFIVIL